MRSLLLLGVFLLPAFAPAPSAVADDGKPWPEAIIETYRLAPGKQEDFIRTLAQWDQVLAAGGQPPIQMFIHQEGDDWDVLLLRPTSRTSATPAQQAAMNAKIAELDLKTGPALFLDIRQNVASHAETKTFGPLSAAQWLARLDAWRAAHPETTKKE